MSSALHLHYVTKRLHNRTVICYRTIIRNRSVAYRVGPVGRACAQERGRLLHYNIDTYEFLHSSHVAPQTAGSLSANNPVTVECAPVQHNANVHATL